MSGPSTPFHPRVAVVTGAAQGIGRAIALQLADDGIDVAVVDIFPKLDLLQEVVEDIAAKGRKAVAIPADIRNDGDVRKLVESTVAELGSLDIMVANAGVAAAPCRLVDANIEDWERMWAVNLRGTTLCYKYAAIQMIKQGAGGRIIGACSIQGKKGMAGSGAYVASKFAMRGITQTVALELAEHRITVNAYAPGLIQTPMTSLPTDTEPCEGVKKAYGLSDVGQPEDIAKAVSYLASPGAQFVTGQTLNVCGSLHFD